MASSIKAIDKKSVHRICSGQVVLTLAVAVKELLENSLDAGANNINVRLVEYGSEILEVTDNGTGVHPDNFEGLTLKHHTSKLNDFSDLESIATFGFRGEALSSLCALSKVTITTRHESQNVGTKLAFDHDGAILSSTQVPRQVGTTVSLCNLFYTLPVRQKEFHRNLKKEFHKMTQLLNAYCLVSTNVKITCTNQTSKGSKTTFVSTPGCSTVKENISSVFGPKQLSGLLELKTVIPSDESLEEMKISKDVADMFKLEGYISSCAHGSGRQTTDRQFYYINSRPCEPSKVMKAVNEIYHQYNVNQVPFIFMNIHVERNSVDVNVTPDKRQVFLDQEKLLISTVKSSLTSIYEKIPSTYIVANIKKPGSLNISEMSPLIQSDEPKSFKPSLSKFTQFRHKSDLKRSSTCDMTVEQKAKQMKLDNHFIKESAYKTKSEIKDSDSFEDDKIICKNSNDIALNACSHLTINSTSSIEAEQNFVEPSVKPLVTQNTQIEPIHVPAIKDIDMVCIDNQIVRVDKNDEKINRSIEKSVANSIKIDYSEDEVSNNKKCDKNSVEKCNLSSQQSKADDGSIRNIDSEKLLINPDSSVEINYGENTSYIDKIDEDIIRTDDDDIIIGERKVINIDFDINMLKDLSEKRRNKEMKNKEIEIKFRTTIDPNKNSQAEQELSREISKDMFYKMEIVGQFNVGFIITLLGSDLFIVDQHATDEKYNFETLQQTTTLSNQQLVVPQNLDLTAANESLLLDNLEVFKKNGFDFIINENECVSKRVKLSAIPMSKNWVFGKEDIDELLFMLQDVTSGTMCRPSRVRSMFASRACRMSVMIGSYLSLKDMRRLIDHMAEIEQPWNCPHGRPTMRHLINLALTE